MSTNLRDDFQSLMDRWSEAIVADDPDAIAQFAEPDWALVGESGAFTADAFLGEVAAGRVTHDTMSHDVHDARRYGDVVVLLTRGRNTGAYNGEEFQLDEWTTEVFVLRPNGWKCIVSPTSPTPPIHLDEVGGLAGTLDPGGTSGLLVTMGTMQGRVRNASWLTASTFGVLAGLGGIRHGIGEVQQGNVRPDGLFIESWTEGPIAEHFDGEPGITIIPNMVATGILAIALSSLVVVWAAFFVQRRRGGAILSLLSVAMMLVGGGIGPPIIGILAGWPGSTIGAGLQGWRDRLAGPRRRRLAAMWRWVYGVAVVNGVFLFVVSIVLVHAFGFQNSDILLWSFYVSVVLLVATTPCAIAHDLEASLQPPLAGSQGDVEPSRPRSRGGSRSRTAGAGSVACGQRQMRNNSESWSVRLLVACVLILVLAGCGDDDEATSPTSAATTESTTSSTQSTTTTESTTSTTESTTSTASTTTTVASTSSQSTTELTTTISYRCGDGDVGSTDIPTGDIEQIDDIVNTVDLCEFKGGLIEISFTAPCFSGDRDVTVPASDGAVPDIATLDLCENP